jgi:signal transduction histidine kinase
MSGTVERVGALPFDEPLTLVTVGVVAVCYLGAGMVAWRLRSRNRLGPLLMTFGVLWTLHQLGSPLWDGPMGVVVAAVVGLWPAVLAHLVVAFPAGRLTGAPARVVVGLAYLCAAAMALRLTVPREAGQAIQGAGILALVLFGVTVIWLQAVRLRRSSATARRFLAPVLVAAVVAIALLIVQKPVTAAGTPPPYLASLAWLALAGIPLAYLASLLRRRIDRGGVAELVVRLSDGHRGTGLQEALAKALHDPHLKVGYWVPESGRYVDVAGEPLPDRPDRVVTRVDRGGPVAVLLHDPALLEAPELIEAACAAASLALENERLTAELRARVRQLAESRTEVLRAAEAERRRIERDLHDGVQQRLLAIPITLSLAESALGSERAAPLIGEARTATLAVLQEVRALSQGIHPPVLTERGLAGAVGELAAVAPLPLEVRMDHTGEGLPPEVETTAYYVVAEALANLAKHASAGRAKVRIAGEGEWLVVEVDDDGRGGADPERGSGLRGLAARVETNGGTLVVESPLGAGTRIRAVLPCA